MKFIKRQLVRLVRFAFVGAAVAGVIVVLDAVLSPDGPDRGE